MTWSGIIDAIRAAEFEPAGYNLELYRRQVQLNPGEGETQQILYLSLLDIAPQKPELTLVLLHGFAASNAWWQKQLLPLAHRNRVIAIDLRGHGRSSRPKSGYTILQMAEDVAAALDALKLQEPVVVAGHSVGGFIATEFALRYPERASKVVLVATPVSIHPSALPTLSKLVVHLPDLLLNLAQPFFERHPKGRSHAYLVGIKQLFQRDLLTWNGEEKFPNLTQPALVIVGDRDYVFPAADFIRVAELIPHSEQVNVGVSKHQILLERPKAVLRAIQRFIEPDPELRLEPGWRMENDDIDSIHLLSERPWVARYGANVPPALDIPHVPLPELLRNATRFFPQRPAIRYKNQSLTYTDLQEEVNRFANALVNLGVQPGERVLLHLPNLPQFVIAFYGLLRSGAVAVLASPKLAMENIVWQAQQTQARILITQFAQAERVRQLREQSNVRHIIYCQEADYTEKGWRKKHHTPRWSDGSQEATQASEIQLTSLHGKPDPNIDQLWSELFYSRASVPPPGYPSPSDPAVILYHHTHNSHSGDAASPEMVVYSHYNLLANTLQIMSWLPALHPGRERLLCTLPFHHAYGLALGVNLSIHLGGELLIPSDPTPLQILEMIRNDHPALLAATPAVYRAFINLPKLASYFSRSGLTRADDHPYPPLCLSAAAPLPVEVKETFERLSMAVVVEGYGGEACQVTHLNPTGATRTGSIGLPLPSTEARLLDLKDNHPLPFGQVGELALRGPQVIQSFKSEKDAGISLDADGWLHTGDIGYMDDDGYFLILGRKQDIWLDAAGNPLFPRDVEEVIFELPEISEVAVVQHAGLPVAFVCLHQGQHLAAEDILSFCRRRLPAGQVPQEVFFVDEFPRTEMGKILREKLLIMHH